jgi:hypothetical protein
MTYGCPQISDSFLPVTAANTDDPSPSNQCSLASTKHHCNGLPADTARGADGRTAQVGTLFRMLSQRGRRANEPDYQHAFWGSHYARLLKIKRAIDPDDVLWCHPCVGDEGWKEEGGKVCQVS